MKNFFCGLIFLITLSSCVSRLDKHGYMFDLSDHELVQEGITTKERVIKIMGSPTTISNFDQDSAWIYYSEDVNRFLFFNPKITARNILVVKFNAKETVKELKKISLQNEEKNLEFVSDYTAVDSHKVGFFKSIFSNVGQIKPQ
jgi:outer membrane protein assembly factor BamE (lipoprotein component of BamABCDE complex)